MSQKPNVIIFGGLNTLSRTLVAHLVPLQGDPLVNHLRIVDKYSINPPTTYLGAEFKDVVKNPIIEYKQANLTVASIVATTFDPPAGQEPYSYVFDLSGEIRWDRPEQVQITQTFHVARFIALESAKRKVKAHVRLQHPFYTSDKKPAEEKDDIKPEGVNGTWWHESLRAIAAIPNLNLVILRTTQTYGPYQIEMISSIFVISAVYAHLRQPVKSLWSPGKFLYNVTHNSDVSAALWRCATWIDEVGGREKAEVLAGEVLHWHNEKKHVSQVEGMVPHNITVKAPLFHLSGNPDLTYNDLLKTIAGVMGTTHEYHDFFTSTAAKFRLEDSVEEINEEHVGAWTQMITTSDPPVPNTPLSAYLDLYLLNKHQFGLSNKRIQEVMGFKPKVAGVTEVAIKELIQKWKDEGSWPKFDH